jgi:hypothetical protein
MEYRSQQFRETGDNENVISHPGHPLKGTTRLPAQYRAFGLGIPNKVVLLWEFLNAPRCICVNPCPFEGGFGDDWFLHVRGAPIVVQSPNGAALEYALSILGKTPNPTYFSPRSARAAIIDEIKTAPESLLRETYDFILFPKPRRALEPDTAKLQTPPHQT